MMLCQVQAFPKSGAGDCDGEGFVSGLCLVPVAIGTPRVCFSKRQPGTFVHRERLTALW